MANQIASRYTKALLQIAVEKGILEQISQDMQCITQVCSTHSSLLDVLRSPVVRPSKKQAVLHAVFQKQLHHLTLSFFVLVTQKHREALLPTMSHAFLTQYYEHQGIKKAQVTTTFPLEDQLTEQLRTIVQKIVPCKKVLLEQHIDPTLIGGYILQVEEKQLDCSLRKKLLKLRKKYITEGY